MQETATKDQLEFETERIGRVSFFFEVLNGIGFLLGLALLWLLEGIRNSFFRLLDRMNVKPRASRASAFPPGRPRTKRTARAEV